MMAVSDSASLLQAKSLLDRCIAKLGGECQADPALRSYARASRELAGACFRTLEMVESISGPTAPHHESKLALLMIKPVGDFCNYACRHCYEDAPDGRFQPGIMAIDLLESILTDAAASAVRPKGLVWHGGEPLLAGKKWFRAALAIQKKLFGSSPLAMSIQTNGALIDDEWMDIFAQYEISVGVSLDGPRDVHDEVRVDRRGRGTFDITLKAISALRDRAIPCGIISVIHPALEGREAEFVRLLAFLHISNLDLHPQHGLDRSIGSFLDPRSYARIMSALFDAWHPLGLRAPRVLSFDEFFRYLAGARPSVCYNNGSCTGIAAVESNGDVVPCTRPFDRNRYTFGNLKHQTLEAILEGHRWTEFAVHDESARLRSVVCSWRGLCNNGCPQHRRGEESDVAGNSVYCSCRSGEAGGVSAIWNHLLKHTIENCQAILKC